MSVRFSQPRIAPHFRDGHLLEEAEIIETKLADPDAPAGHPPPYDCVLVCPFPAIRIISWLPKLRRPDGEAERDEYGDPVLGQRAWFALDNRRLHTMQRAAAKHWPKRCCVVVRCIEEVPGSTIRELRKFRTTTQGKSVEVGVRVGDTESWCWEKDAPAGTVQPGLEVEAEGLFAEDLWDAILWAPHVVETAIEIRPSKEERERARAASSNGDALVHVKPARTPEPPASPQQPAAATLQHSMPKTVLQPAIGQTTAAAAPRLAPAVEQLFQLNGGRTWRLALCPASGWQYIDPGNRIQGPFTLEKMRLWHQHGFFYPALRMRCDPGDEFRPFAELWPPGQMAFMGHVIQYRNEMS